MGGGTETFIAHTHTSQGGNPGGKAATLSIYHEERAGGQLMYSLREDVWTRGTLDWWWWCIHWREDCRGFKQCQPDQYHYKPIHLDNILCILKLKQFNMITFPPIPILY